MNNGVLGEIVNTILHGQKWVGVHSDCLQEFLYCQAGFLAHLALSDGEFKGGQSILLATLSCLWQLL